MSYNAIGLYVADSIIIIIIIIGCCYHKTKYNNYIENNDENIDKLENFINNNNIQYLQDYDKNSLLV